MKIIDAFDGEFRFLSNFWPSKVHYDGMTSMASAKEEPEQ